MITDNSKSKICFEIAQNLLGLYKSHTWHSSLFATPDTKRERKRKNDAISLLQILTELITFYDLSIRGDVVEINMYTSCRWSLKKKYRDGDNAEAKDLMDNCTKVVDHYCSSILR